MSEIIDRVTLRLIRDLSDDANEAQLRGIIQRVIIALAEPTEPMIEAAVLAAPRMTGTEVVASYKAALESALV